MSTALTAAAWPACLSALRLDRFLSGELSPSEAGAVREHVDGCARCAAALSGLEAARDGARLPPLRALESPVEAAQEPLDAGAPAPVLRLSRRRRVLSVALGGLAAAAGLALALRGEAPSERLKGAGPGQGGVAWGAWVLHDGAVRRAGPGEVVAPGDALRFAVTAPAPGYVAVLSLDPAGRASVYFPAGARAEPVAPGAEGAEVALPLATKLDATLGEERLYALYCQGPVELEPVRAALEGAGRLEAGAAPGGDAAAAPAGCQVTGWRFEKR